MPPARLPSEPTPAQQSTLPVTAPDVIPVDGFEWTLSDETRATLAEIDASIRQARIDGPRALFD